MYMYGTMNLVRLLLLLGGIYLFPLAAAVPAKITCGPEHYADPDKHEVQKTLCSSAGPGEILCEEYYFRTNGKCVPCSECDGKRIKKQSCRGYNDTVCCAPSEMVFPGPNGSFICKESGGQTKKGIPPVLPTKEHHKGSASSTERNLMLCLVLLAAVLAVKVLVS